MFAQSKNYGDITVDRYYAAARKQQRNCVFSAVRAGDCACNNGIRHVIAKQQLHCNRGTVFSTRSMPRCCKQDNLGAAVKEKSR
jgi:hypothetical protein